MLRVLSLAVVVALSACAGEEPTPPTITVTGANDAAIATADIHGYEIADGADETSGDPCALAEALPLAFAELALRPSDDTRAQLIRVLGGSPPFVTDCER